MPFKRHAVPFLYSGLKSGEVTNQMQLLWLISLLQQSFFCFSLRVSKHARSVAERKARAQKQRKQFHIHKYPGGSSACSQYHGFREQDQALEFHRDLVHTEMMRVVGVSCTCILETTQKYLKMQKGRLVPCGNGCICACMQSLLISHTLHNG